MKVSIALVLLVLVSCSQVKKKASITTTTTDTEGPEWIYAASEGCLKTEICASGEGESFTSSDAHSKKALAGIFETKVTSEFQFSKTSFTGDEKNRMQEYVADEIKQQVNYLLKGAYIKKRFKKHGVMFSLAAINKNIAAKLITQELDQVDDEISQLYLQRSRILINKLVTLFNKREMLNEKIILINGVGSQRRIELSQINELKFKIGGDRKIIFRASNDTPRVLKKKLEENFTSIGYKLVTSHNNWLVEIDYKMKEEYLKVRGFKKFTFSINLEAKNSFGKKIGSYIVAKVSNGRNEQDAFFKVRPQIIKEIEENIDKLNLR